MQIIEKINRVCTMWIKLMFAVIITFYVINPYAFHFIEVHHTGFARIYAFPMQPIKPHGKPHGQTTSQAH